MTLPQILIERMEKVKKQADSENFSRILASFDHETGEAKYKTISYPYRKNGPSISNINSRDANDIKGICVDRCRFIKEILPLDDSTSPEILEQAGEQAIYNFLDITYLPGVGTYCKCVENHLDALI